MVHKFVCGGECGWYKTKSREAGFDRRSVTTEQQERIEGVIREVMRGVPMNEAKADIHEFICPSEPRPSY